MTVSDLIKMYESGQRSSEALHKVLLRLGEESYEIWKYNSNITMAQLLKEWKLFCSIYELNLDLFHNFLRGLYSKPSDLEKDINLEKDIKKKQK